jgi:hypothetical protein
MQVTPSEKYRLVVLLMCTVTVFTLAAMLSYAFIPFSPIHESSASGLVMISVLVGIVTAVGFLINRLLCSKI